MNLDYEIIFAKRRTIGIVVDREGRVIVRAPWQVPPEAISAVVERKRLWIWEKLRDGRKSPASWGRKEFVAGETFFFLGQNHSLELTDMPSGEVRLRGRLVQLSRVDREQGHQLFREWFISRAKLHIVPRVTALARAMGIGFKHVSVRELKYS
jgi:predicted metal-dependent hydrolase